MILKKLTTAFLIGASAIAVAQVKPNLSATNEPATITQKYKETSFVSTTTLVDNLNKSTSFSYTTELLKNPEISSAINSTEMVTIFIAPDAYFNKMEKEQREALLGSPNLVKRFKTHMVPGRLDENSLRLEIKKRNGSPISLKTLSGNQLGVKLKNDKLFIVDAENNTAEIVNTNFYHKNGFFHITDGYLLDIKK